MEDSDDSTSNLKFFFLKSCNNWLRLCSVKQKQGASMKDLCMSSALLSKNENKVVLVVIYDINKIDF